MIPVLFRIGPIPINSYGLMLVTGFIFGYFLLSWEYRDRGVSVDFASTEITLGMIGAIVGSRIFHVLEHLDAYSLDHIERLFKGSGFSWYGGFVMVSILVLWYAHRKGIRWTTVVDATSPGTAIGYGFGRIGCFLSGDGCYGEPCSVLHLTWPAPFCMAFPNGAVPTSEVVLNTPIIEVFGAVFTFAVLMLLRRPLIKRPASLFAVFVIMHGIMRFMIEYVRLNPKFGPFSQAQWVSICAVAIGVWLLARPPAPDPEPALVQGKKKNKKRQATSTT
ncbi:MAG: prolipoprotein diacylglyceryl transferase [Myxococcota bacterium]|jgi:phosphatidylglycerol:prolipoprotein diacylglycerol transferase